MQNSNFRNILIVVAVVLLVVIVSRNRGAQQQVAQPDPQQIAQQVGQQVGAEIAKQVEQVAEPFVQPQVQPDVVDVTAQLNENGMPRAQWTWEQCRFADKYGLGDIIPLGNQRYLWIAFSGRQFEKDGVGCMQWIIIADSVPQLNPLDCVFVHQDRQHKGEAFQLDGVWYTPIDVLEIYKVLQHGQFHPASGYSCVNGDPMKPKAKG